MCARTREVEQSRFSLILHKSENAQHKSIVSHIRIFGKLVLASDWHGQSSAGKSLPKNDNVVELMMRKDGSYSFFSSLSISLSRSLITVVRIERTQKQWTITIGIIACGLLCFKFISLAKAREVLKGTMNLLYIYMNYTICQKYRRLVFRCDDDRHQLFSIATRF